LILLLTTPVRAEFRQIDITIYGMDWAVCAHAVSVRLRRLDGVEAVKVSLNEGRASIWLKADNRVSLRQVHTVVEQGGFTPREARVTGRAEVVVEQERLRVRLVGSGETYPVAQADAATRAELKKQAGRTVVLEGVISAPGGEAPPAVQVLSVEPSTQRQ
jgi:copper chaperone CopZ